MQTSTPRLLSLAIALVCVVLSLTEHSAGAALYASVVLMVPLALIWFPEKLGSMTGYFLKGSYVNAESPPTLLSIIGWLLLVGLPALFYLLG